MINIRNSLFETNSSSADVYDDNDTRLTSRFRQTVHIPITWADDVSDECIDEIFDKIYSDSDFLTKYFDILGISDDEPDLIDGGDGDDIGFTIELRAIIYEDKYGDREIDWDSIENWPYKNEEYSSKKSDIEKLMKLFKEYGFTEIISVNNIYGEELDEYEILDNAEYD